MSKIILVLLVIIICSCATYSIPTATKDECLKTNWHEVGRMSGNSGSNNVSAISIGSECLEHEYSIDFKKFYDGVRLGLQMYCNPESAYVSGAKNHSFRYELCPHENRTDLESRHQEGVIDLQNKVIKKILQDNYQIEKVLKTTIYNNSRNGTLTTKEINKLKLIFLNQQKFLKNKGYF